MVRGLIGAVLKGGVGVGGGGSGTQTCGYQKWPHQIVPTVNVGFSHNGPFGRGGGGGLAPKKLTTGLGLIPKETQIPCRSPLAARLPHEMLRCFSDEVRFRRLELNRRRLMVNRRPLVSNRQTRPPCRGPGAPESCWHSGQRCLWAQGRPAPGRWGRGVGPQQ